MDVEMLSGFSISFTPKEGFCRRILYLESKDKDELLEALSVEETAILADLSPMTRNRTIRGSPGQVIPADSLNLLSPHDYRETVELLGYPDEA